MKCGNAGESIEHIMDGCPTLAENAYLNRHNQLSKMRTSAIGNKIWTVDTPTPAYYKYLPAPVVEKNKVNLYWDRPILTDRIIDYNRPDILLINNTAQTAIIVEIGVPLTHNLKKTEIEKKKKYELATQLKTIWKLSMVTICPLVMSAEGVVLIQLW